MEYGTAHGWGGGAKARPGGAISIELRDIVGLSRRELGDVDVLIAGDVMYEDAFAARVTEWLEHFSYLGCRVLVGDPGRLSERDSGERTEREFIDNQEVTECR
jgi:hypothetical protein